MTAATAERLRRAVAAHAAVSGSLRKPPPPVPKSLPPVAELLGGDWHQTPHGPTFVRDEWYAGAHLHGALPLDAPFGASPASLGMLSTTREAPDPSRLAFFDIETTGLSGGAGTKAFLVGLGSFEADGYRMRQYFLADLAHEPAMLAMLAEDLRRFDGIVTYNGRAFDVPIIEGRLTMARLPSPCRGMAHLDLLPAVRRLYRHRMPGCRLAEAERRLLRIEREEDTPGWLMPSLYFDYIRAGRIAPLAGVFRHNADDVMSLAGILWRLASLLDGTPEDPEDGVAVARWWERDGDSERAMELYRSALPWLEGGDDWAWAASRHAMLCRRAGIREEAVPLWERLWSQGDRGAGLELAKHFEHRVRDLRRAEDIVRTLAAGAATTEHDALAKRMARLRRKLAR